MADIVSHGPAANDVLSVTTNNSGIQDNVSALHPSNWSHSGLSDVEYMFMGVFMPCLALCGVVGNLLNLTILSWRCSKREVDVLERGALLGLIALAVSDMCFCLCIVPNLAFYENQTLFLEKNFRYYFELYQIYFRNVFIKVSTWLTVIIATARFVAICHPLKARIFTGLLTTKCAIVTTYVTWFLLMVPLIWWREVHEYPENHTQSALVMDMGYFMKSNALNLAFTYMWAVFGYFIPVTILTFCNIRLIFALRRARRWRENSAHNHRSNGRDANARITSTLVALILMFIILVTPSELLYFLEATNALVSPVPEAAIWCTNLLQAINFGFHFVLYCAVNATFRRAIVTMFYTVFGKISMRTKHEELEFRRPNSMNTGHMSIMFKSVETNV